MKKIPKAFQGILWSKRVDKLSLPKDKDYIIHQVLSYGDLKEIKWLFKAFSKKEIIQTFLKSPRRTYSPSSFNFVANYFLNLKGKKINPQDYVKTFF